MKINAYVSTILSKEIDLDIDDSVIEVSPEFDDEGYAFSVRDKLSDDVLEHAFASQYLSIDTLLHILKTISKSNMNKAIHNIKEDNSEYMYWRRIYNECKGWVSDNISIIEN